MKRPAHQVVLEAVMSAEEYGVLNCQEADDRFERLLQVLDIGDETAELAFCYWLKLSDHEQPSRLPPPTINEAWAIAYVADQIEKRKVLL